MQQRLFLRVPGPLPGSESKRIVADLERRRTRTGWRFKHLIESPRTEDGQPVQWYVAWYDGDLEGRRRDLPNGPRWLPWLPPAANWKAVHEMAVEISEAAHEALGAYPQLIEPGLVFDNQVAGPGGEPLEARAARAKKAPPEVTLGLLPSKFWPGVKKDGLHDPVWHLDSDHSQLADARARARAKNPGAAREIRIGIIDNGFDDRHPAWPLRVVDEKRGDAIQELLPEFAECDEGCQEKRISPGKSLGSHGTGALGILAGRRVFIPKDQCAAKRVRYDPEGVEIGAAPDAEIVTVRVAPDMLSLATANFAYGVDYASRVQRCDVISMSHGGSPSQMWADAVNAAYARGTAMFAATGDYFCFPLLPGLPGRLNAWSFIPTLPPPSSTVYPAAWRRVMGVSGVTASGAPYALTDRRHWLPRCLKVREREYWMRGSYGADDVRRSLLGGFAFLEHWKTDKSMRRRQNELRANAVSAFAPGIPWPVAGKEGLPSNVLDLDGSGTSSAAPQAAAAAAHWLAFHKNAIPACEWNSWRKAEAVYAAMVYSALRPWEKGSGRAPENQRPDVFLGAGILKASDMLDISYERAKSIQGDTLRFPAPGKVKWGDRISEDEAAGGVPKDYYDGDRGYYAAVIDPIRFSRIEGGDRVQLREKPCSSREAAYEQLFFNMLLVERWQWGMTPVKTTSLQKYPWHAVKGVCAGITKLGPMNEPQLEAEAKRRARNALAEPGGPRRPERAPAAPDGSRSVARRLLFRR